MNRVSSRCRRLVPVAAILAAALLAAGPLGPTRAAAPGADAARVWSSAAACRDVVERGHRRLAATGDAARLRIAAWNIRY